MIWNLRQHRRLINLWLGPATFLLLEAIGGPESMSQEAFHVLASTAWIAIWWISEALPISVTALLPIILFPLTGAVELATTTAAFGHKYIFLYMGGFILAIAIEKWGLHKRIALNIINHIGSGTNQIILGFMIATAFLSMWISNTATAVMMVPIGAAIVSQFSLGKSLKRDEHPLGKTLMLAIAYSASIGGFATLIGTPPNLVLAGVLEQNYNVKLSFFEWMSFGVPISLLLLFICWKFLTKYTLNLEEKEFPGGKEQIKKLRSELGKITREERSVLIVFIMTAVCWMGRSLIQKVIPTIDDTIIAVIAGTVLFVIPTGKKGEMLIKWEEAVKIPWGIILLFGGGMALAKGFTSTGLAEWIALQMSNMQGLSLLLLILVLVAIVNFLTEITSNLATTAMLLPILAPMALAFDLHPYMILVSVTIAASCAFMLPVATPPNAVVFGSGYLRIPDMIRAGIFMNVISILIITIFTYYFLPVVWGFDPGQFPEMFKAVP
ncbi:MAG: SLC13 family permease [Cyclobacteriaceae bacterium]